VGAGDDAAAKSGGVGKVATKVVGVLADCTAVFANNCNGAAETEAFSVLGRTEDVVEVVVLAGEAIFSTTPFARFCARFFDAEPILREPKTEDRNIRKFLTETEDRITETEDRMTKTKAN
jgi:hypothetical protein